MTTILVIGGAGYIGSQTCKILKAQGYDPVVYDNFSRGRRELVKWGRVIEGDILDKPALIKAMKEVSPNAVFHFAGFAYVGESVSNPGLYYRNNVVGSLNILEAMCECQVPYLVFSSTCATYGEPLTIPMLEKHSQNPINPYGMTKLVMERMMSDFSVAHNLRFVALRYFNAAGADPEGETGEHHIPETHLIPLVLDAAAGVIPKICVFGSDYDTPDGTCIRDYIHTYDLGTAHSLAYQYMEKGGRESFFNLGNGSGFSVLEVISTAEKYLGKIVPHEIQARRPGDPPRLIGDASKAKEILGWQPKYPDLAAIILHAWQYRQQRVS